MGKILSFSKKKKSVKKSSSYLEYMKAIIAVSYTHLTLPTIRTV